MVGWQVGNACASDVVIATLRVHPRVPGVVVVAVPEDANAIMGRFGPAKLSVDQRGYLVESSLIDGLVRLLQSEHVTVVDERDVRQPTMPEPGRYNPLPECANCGQPRRRVRMVDGVPVPVDAPLRCVDCGHRWLDHEYGGTASRPPLADSDPDAHRRLIAREHVQPELVADYRDW